MSSSIRTFIHLAFLVAGTCIGGGMLAQPAQVARNGLFPSILLIFICALFMCMTALLILEAASRLPAESHLPTVASTYLSWPGKWIGSILYLFIAYASLIAYISASSDLLVNSTSFFHHFSTGLPLCLGACGTCQVNSTLFCCAIATVVLYTGHRIAAYLNTTSVVGLLFIFVAILSAGYFQADSQRLLRVSFDKIDHALGLFLAAFSFQMIVPSLRQYTSDYRLLRSAIVFGVVLTALIYSVWLTFVFGLIPIDGPMGLDEIAKKELPITVALMQIFPHSGSLSLLIALFTLLALATSFIGISLGLYDFLEDILNLSRSKMFPSLRRLLLVALIMLPTLFFSLQFEHLFATALDLTGGIGDSILNGLMPVAMVLVGAKFWGKAIYELKPRMPILVFCALFSLYALYIEVVKFL